MVHLNITKILNNIYLKFPEFSSYRPQRSCGKVMFLHLSMGVSVHGGGGWGRGLCLWGSLSCRVFVWGECLCPGASLSGGLYPGGLCPGGLCQGDPPPPPRATVRLRAVGMHTTGMDSCILCYFPRLFQSDPWILDLRIILAICNIPACSEDGAGLSYNMQ